MMSTFQDDGNRTVPALGAELTFRAPDGKGNIVTRNARVGDIATGFQHEDVTVTAAQVLALNATAIEIIPAAGAGITILPKAWAAYKAAGTAYAGIAAGEDLVLRYTNASGAICGGAIETTGFLDQTTAQTRIEPLPPVSSFAPAANAPVMIHLLTDEITTGDSDLIVRVWYDLIDTSF